MTRGRHGFGSSWCVTALMCVIALALGSCGGVNSTQSMEVGSGSENATVSIPTVHGPCTVRPGNTCKDVTSSAGSYDSTAFDKMIFVNASFTSGSFNGASFSGVTAQFADFSRASLAGAVFRNADLTGSRFDGALLTGADFSGANLLGASFVGAKVDNVAFPGTRMGSAACPEAAGGACIVPEPQPAAAHLAVSNDDLRVSVDLHGDATGKLLRATITWQALTNLGTVYKYDWAAKPYLQFPTELLPSPQPGDPPKTWDITAAMLETMAAHKGTGVIPQGTVISFDFTLQHTGRRLLSLTAVWQGGVDAGGGLFSASGADNGTDALVSFSLMGDADGNLNSAKVTSAAKTTNGVVGVVGFTVTQPGASPVQVNVDLPDAPDPEDPPKSRTWDITKEFVKQVGTRRLAATTAFSAQFFGPDRGGPVGPPLVDTWLAGPEPGIGFAAKGSGAAGDANLAFNAAGDRAAKVAEFTISIAPDPKLPMPTRAEVSVAVPQGDDPINTAKFPLTLKPGPQTLTVTDQVIAAWPLAVVPPNSVFRLSVFAGNDPAPSAVVAGSWAAMRTVPVSPGSSVVTNWKGATLTSPDLGCVDGVSPFKPGAQCTQVTGVDFGAAAQFTWGKAQGLRLDGVNLPNTNLEGPASGPRLDLTGAQLKNMTLGAIRNVSMPQAQIDVVLNGPLERVDAVGSVIGLNARAWAATVSSADFSGADVTFRMYAITSVCFKGATIREIRNIGSIDKSDFFGAKILRLTAEPQPVWQTVPSWFPTSNSSFANADFSDSAIENNSFVSDDFAGAKLGNPARWIKNSFSSIPMAGNLPDTSKSPPGFTLNVCPK